MLEREREKEREEKSCRKVFVHDCLHSIFFGYWILISSYAIYKLMLNFVMCFFRVKHMRSKGVIIRMTRWSGIIQQKRNKSLNIGEKEKTKKMRKTIRDILLIMMTMMTTQVCKYMSCISYGIESIWQCLILCSKGFFIMPFFKKILHMVPRIGLKNLKRGVHPWIPQQLVHANWCIPQQKVTHLLFKVFQF